tara:strand:+ start:2626 stop:3051 length:426 start_codon:yes stop_codon:yes gene_type:complete
MHLKFKIIPSNEIKVVIPFVKKMAKVTISDSVLLSRFKEMVNQDYECLGVYIDEELVGICGMWFSTRHYCGKSVEIDHLYVIPKLRNNNIGGQIVSWVEKYAISKGFNAIELNAYIDNERSQKFYLKQGYKKLGFHFLKPI